MAPGGCGALPFSCSHRYPHAGICHVLVFTCYPAPKVYSAMDVCSSAATSIESPQRRRLRLSLCWLSLQCRQTHTVRNTLTQPVFFLQFFSERFVLTVSPTGKWMPIGPRLSARFPAGRQSSHPQGAKRVIFKSGHKVPPPGRTLRVHVLLHKKPGCG